jgi:hypothetical protein
MLQNGAPHVSARGTPPLVTVPTLGFSSAKSTLVVDLADANADANADARLRS